MRKVFRLSKTVECCSECPACDQGSNRNSIGDTLNSWKICEKMNLRNCPKDNSVPNWCPLKEKEKRS
jgi:hypothetical protein